MSVYSFLHYVTGKVQLNEALTSTRRHWSPICKVKTFWHARIFIFTLCQGQSSVERGFNISKEILVDNLKENNSGMSVYSFLHYVTGNVQFNEAITSTRRHWSTIWKKRLLTCLYIHFYMMSRANFSWTRLKKQGRHWSTIWKKRFMACLYIHFFVMSRAKFSWTRL